MNSTAGLHALRDFALILYSLGMNTSLLVFVIRAEIHGKPKVRTTSWSDFAEDVGGFWLDMLAHMLAWPWFAWKAIR